MTSTTTVAKIPTGVPGFDTISNGGIPKGRSTLVVGRAGTGKTILGLQIASHMAGLGIKTVLVAVEESPEDLVMTGDTLGLKLSEAIKEGRLPVTDASRPMDGPMVVTGDYDISGLTHRIEAIVKQTGAQAIVVDSATALFSPGRRRSCCGACSSSSSTPSRRWASPRSCWRRRRRTTAQLDHPRRRGLRLRRGGDPAQHHRRRAPPAVDRDQQVPAQPHYKGEYPCTITANGLTIFPSTPRTVPDSRTERYSERLARPGRDDRRAACSATPS